MFFQCVFWIFAIYGMINICINLLFQIKYKDVLIIIKIDNSKNFETVVRTFIYKFWYFNNIIYINDSKENDTYDIIKKLKDDYGIKVINLR